MTSSASNNAKKAMNTITNMQRYIRHLNNMRYNDALLRSFEYSTGDVQDKYTNKVAVYTSLIKFWRLIEGDFKIINGAVKLIQKYEDAEQGGEATSIVPDLEGMRTSLQASYTGGETLVANIYEQYGEDHRIMNDRDMLIGLYSVEVVQATVFDLIQALNFTLGSSITPPYSNYDINEIGNSGNTGNNAMLVSGFKFVKGMRAAIKNFIVLEEGGNLSKYTKDSYSAISKPVSHICNERFVLNILMQIWAAVHDSSKVINETLTLIDLVNRNSNNNYYGIDSMRPTAEEQMESLQDQAVAIDRLRMGTAVAFKANGTIRVQTPSSPDVKRAVEALGKVEQLLVAVGRELVDTFALNAEPI